LADLKIILADFWALADHFCWKICTKFLIFVFDAFRFAVSGYYSERQEISRS